MRLSNQFHLRQIFAGHDGLLPPDEVAEDDEEEETSKNEASDSGQHWQLVRRRQAKPTRRTVKNKREVKKISRHFEKMII